MAIEAGPETFDEAIREFDELADGVMNSDHRTFDDNLQRFVALQRSNFLCQQLYGQIALSADFEAFWAEAQSSRGSMVGSGRLSYPTDSNGRLFLQTQMITAIADGKVDADSFFVDFFYSGSRLDDNLRSFLQQFFRVYIRDYRNRLLKLTPSSKQPPDTVTPTPSPIPTPTPSPHPTPTPTPTPLSINPPPEAPNVESGNSNISIGRGNNFTRNAEGNEVVLNVDRYAEVIATLLSVSDRKDLCLGIFGPWGRGKTFLADRIVNVVERGNIPKKPAYEVVRFSAWKYPSRPEVWVYLYETILQKLEARGWWRSIAHVVRTGVYRAGVPKLTFVWLAMIVTVFPKGWLFHAVDQYFLKYLLALDRGLALASLIFAALFIVQFWKTKKILEHEFLKSPRHSDKLGLQATIGKDFTALLKGWIGVPNDAVRRVWKIPIYSLNLYWERFWLAIALLVLLITWRAGDAVALGLLFSLAVFLPAFGMRCAFLTSSPSPDRLLLIVDDLDRCQPNHLLAVMESIKLLLEDPQVSRRIQVIMLVEEEILQHALWEKYRHLLDPNARGALHTTYSAPRIVRENFDKLFTAHLRLPPLSEQEIENVVMAFGLSEETDAAGKTSTSTARRAKDSRPSAQSAQGNRTLAEPESSGPLSNDEKKIIVAALIKNYTKPDGELGPRALRAFMFRYQIARLILNELGESAWTPDGLATTILEFQNNRKAVDSSAESIVVTVARQVA